jgi:hypothetical protein
MNKVCGTTKFSPAVDTFYEWELENFPQLVQFFGEDGVESTEFKIVSSTTSSTQSRFLSGWILNLRGVLKSMESKSLIKTLFSLR